jgi:hypothetical protein
VRANTAAMRLAAAMGFDDDFGEELSGDDGGACSVVLCNVQLLCFCSALYFTCSCKPAQGFPNYIAVFSSLLLNVL